MPRSTSNSSTSRYDRPQHRYHRTATTMASAGNRKPANAEQDGASGREREDNFTGTSCPNPLTIA